MKLSIIIVNYNVRYFLEQSLHSINKAIKDAVNYDPNFSCETFVVDNNSVDGSVSTIKEKFPHVILIENKKNTGFSCANNQVIKLVKGKYILLLNPDTVVQEDTFTKVINFMDNHPDAGALGVKMIDGSGNFLPESKRGFPSPSVAFYKIFGLAKLFPKSKTFGKYHLGYLDENKTHEVDVLAGAFMLLRKDVLDKVGLLDEAFFMYGEDIDLSYRIKQAGYKNYYYPEACIIHYKGESTKKSSINYVFVFYKAMIIFANKHFSEKNAKIFSLLIHLAIYFRASIAVVSRFLKKISLPAMDAVLLYVGIYFIKNYWEHNVKNVEGLYYPIEFITITVPCYISVWLLSVYLNGGYDKPIKLYKITRGIFTGTILILVIYALLDESYRYSRALILLGAAWASIAMLVSRYFISLFKHKDFVLEDYHKKKILIVGEAEESSKVLSLLTLTNSNTSFTGFVRASEHPTPNNESYLSANNNNNNTYYKHCLGTIIQLNEIIEVYKIDEIIFCAKDITSQQIINLMSKIKNRNIEFKIVPPESLYIIGSSTVNSSGDFYIMDINTITKAINKRNKRMLDIFVCGCLLVSSPLMLFFIKNPLNLFFNIFKVSFNNYSWVGYANTDDTEFNLPYIKKGILSPLDSIYKKSLDINTINKLNMLYAKDYKVNNDINIIIQGFRSLGRVCN